MRNQTDNRIFSALSCALTGAVVPWWQEMDDEALAELFSECEAHGVLALAADAFPQDVIWNGKTPFSAAYAPRVRRTILCQANNTAEFCLLYRFLRSKGLHPLVMKGVVCRALYPAPEHRPSVDEDFLIKPAEFRRLHEAMLEYGLTPDSGDRDPMEQYEIAYRDPKRGIFIEAHKTPFLPGAAFIDKLNDSFLGVYDRAIVQRIHGTDFLTLEPEDHLTYLLLHALKHFLHCGFGIRQICDIGLYAEAYRAQIDWDHLRAQLKQLNALDFACAVFRIAGEHLLPENHMAEYLAGWDLAGVDPEPLLADVMEGGIYGSTTMSRIHSGNMTLHAASSQSTRESSAVLHSLFPDLESMQRKFPYLKKLPALLPLAWVQRHLGYLWELIRHRNRKNSALTSIRVGSERIKLLKEYRIIV